VLFNQLRPQLLFSIDPVRLDSKLIPTTPAQGFGDNSSIFNTELLFFSAPLKPH
jgi:hypothetical protein